MLRELRAKQTHKQGPGEPQTMSQASVATSVTDLSSTPSLTTATCAMSQPAVTANWATVVEDSQARISCLLCTDTVHCVIRLSVPLRCDLIKSSVRMYVGPNIFLQSKKSVTGL